MYYTKRDVQCSINWVNMKLDENFQISLDERGNIKLTDKRVKGKEKSKIIKYMTTREQVKSLRLLNEMLMLLRNEEKETWRYCLK